MTEDPKPVRPPEPPRTEEPRTIASTDLFQGAREIVIRHEGMLYHLRITRRNKLILN